MPSYFFYYYYRDVNAVYALTADAKDLVRLQDANPKTFRILRGEESIAKDDNRVYAAGKEMTNIDAKTFTFLSGELYKDVDKVFHHDPLTKQLTEMTTTNDVATLRAALKTQFPDSPAYMIDVNGVYYAGRKIHGADPETFELLDSNKREDGYGGLIGDINRYARDKTNVYYHGVIIAGADAKTFQLISTGGSTDEFGKDAKHVFYLSSMIEEANPSTFTPLTFQIKEGCRPGPYSKDAQHVFFGVHLIKDADHDSFMVDEWGSGPYGRDKMHVFESGVLRADLDVKNFSSPCNYG